MLEARCTRCREVFLPGDPTDLEHGITDDGDECGGLGIILGAWGPTAADVARQLAALPPMTAAEEATLADLAALDTDAEDFPQ